MIEAFCLGIGKVYTDRTAQIQLALFLALVKALHIATPAQIFDPVFEAGDREVLQRLNLTVMAENLVQYNVG